MNIADSTSAAEAAARAHAAGCAEEEVGAAASAQGRITVHGSVTAKSFADGWGEEARNTSAAGADAFLDGLSDPRDAGFNSGQTDRATVQISGEGSAEADAQGEVKIKAGYGDA
jgi:hypothetical protein